MRVYNPHERKLDPRTTSGFFIGYPLASKGFRFYCPGHHTRIVESLNVKFLEDHIDSSSSQSSESLSTQSFVDPNSTVVNENKPETVELAPIQPMPLRRSQRERRPALPDDYMVYFGEVDYDIGEVVDSVTFLDVIHSPQYDKWNIAMKEEMLSMANNGVWDLVEMLENFKPIGCKWVFKTKKDAKGKIERLKARLVAKGYTQKVGVDYTETFSPVSSKDSFIIIMALTTHFNLELHQIDDKTAFLNGDLYEEVYMQQSEGFVVDGKENIVCRLQKFIYSLKQASRQWYLKFHDVVPSLDFEENTVDSCIYLKINGRKFIFLILYVDDILLASNDLGLLMDVKRMLSQNFDMKDLGEANFVLGIEIHRDRDHKFLGLSQKAYVDRVMERFGMKGCKPGLAPIFKGDRLNKDQCPKNDVEKAVIKDIPYSSVVGSLMYSAM